MSIESLVTAIENGTILGPETFRTIDVSAVLDGRDQPPFDSEWIRVFNTLEAKAISQEQTDLLNRLRELAYKATFEHTSNPDLSGYVSDDFELIGRAVALDLNDEWLNVLFKTCLDSRASEVNLRC